MSTYWLHPGARWWKFDFHTHTPASVDTTAWQQAIGTDNEVTPEKWLRKFMEAEVDCVAITDHNSGDWIDRLKSEYGRLAESRPEGFRQLHLFPGVEISVNGGVHLLAIFGQDATSADITSLLGAVEYQGTRGDSDGVTSKSAADVVKAVLDAGGIAIPAHSDGPKGLLCLKEGSQTAAAIDTNTLKQVLDIDGVLAAETVQRTSPKPAIYSEMKIGWTDVLGSDCHSFQGPKVPGSHYTWVKMATPSLEGLRLALIDGEGISVRRSDEGEFDPFQTPEHFIEAIEIHEAQVMGRGKPSELPFSPYFNALVGGRGTGKSTVIHAFRLALRKKDEIEALDDTSEALQTFEQFNKVPSKRGERGGLRPTTAIRVTVARDGLRHRISWRQDGTGHSVEDFDGSNWVASSSQTITAQRFPARLFSQGQIADLAGDSSAPLLDVIDDSAGTAQQKTRFAEAKGAFLVQRAKVRELTLQLASLETTQIELQDVKRKISRFEESHHAEILKAYQSSNRKQEELSRIFEEAKELARGVEDSSLILTSPVDGLFERPQDSEALNALSELHGAIADAKVAIDAAATSLLEKVQVIADGLRESEWESRVQKALGAYETLRADLAQTGIDDPSQYGRLVAEQQRLETEMRRLESIESDRRACQEVADAQLLAVWAARREISAARQHFLAEALGGNPYVRIELLAYGRDEGRIEAELRELIGRSTNFEADIYTAGNVGAPPVGLVADLVNAVPNQNPSEVMETRVRTVQERLVEACLGRGDFGAWFNRYLEGEAQRRPEFVDHIRCWFPDDSLKVEYSRKGDGRDFQPIGQASAGQRAAAMLALLLAHGDEPLILDQPEDDLDNHLIYDLVVRQIREQKVRRQIIVVTHNANVVINGDSEMVHVLDFNSQCYVKQSGSLQEQLLRGEVCKVLEGGTEAFERRYKRMGQSVLG